mgnify:CR=1 FL=1
MVSKAQQEEDEVRALRERTAHIEKDVHETVRRRQRVSKNVALLHREQLTFGQRVSDRLAETAGSWRFIIGFGVFLVAWVIVNSIALVKHWDEFPFILLNLVLSMLAAIQAPVIMMSQNRQEAHDRVRAEHDYAVNLKAELEIEQLHDKLDGLRERQWSDLLAIQKQQIDLLEAQLQLLKEAKGGERGGAVG